MSGTDVDNSLRYPNSPVQNDSLQAGECHPIACGLPAAVPLKGSPLEEMPEPVSVRAEGSVSRQTSPSTTPGDDIEGGNINMLPSIPDRVTVVTPVPLEVDGQTSSGDEGSSTATTPIEGEGGEGGGWKIESPPTVAPPAASAADDDAKPTVAAALSLGLAVANILPIQVPDEEVEEAEDAVMALLSLQRMASNEPTPRASAPPSQITGSKRRAVSPPGFEGFVSSSRISPKGRHEFESEARYFCKFPGCGKG
jgi:hypothetical protein